MSLRHSLASASDEDLMLRIQADDTPAFEELYHRHSARAFGLARFICGGSHRAEEAMQEGFVSVWRSRDSYDPVRGGAKTWVLAVIRNRSLDIMRQGGRDDRRLASEAQLEYLQAPESVAAAAEKRDKGGRLRASLRDLPPLQREVIALAYFGGLTHTEIASRLELPVGTVKGRMRLGLDRMRTRLAPVVDLSGDVIPLAGLSEQL